MYGPAEQELRRLGRRCAGVLHLVVAAVACVLAVTVAPSAPVLGAVGAVTAWSVGYFLLSRSAGTWLVAADVVVVGVACLTQRWTVPPDALASSTSWLLAVTSIAVATWQWHDGVRVGAIATAAVILAWVAGAEVLSDSLLVGWWLVLEAVLSRGLYQLVRAGAREADRIMAGAEQARRDAAVAAARRADEREHLAAIHDTAAATFQAIGAGVVTGREPWLDRQLADALDEVTGNGSAEGGDNGIGLRPPVPVVPRGTDSSGASDAARPVAGRRDLTDLVPLLDDVVRNGPVTAELAVSGPVDDLTAPAPDRPVEPSPVPLPPPVAVAVCRATREALRNVARHAGVDRAAVRLAHRDGTVLVEIADDGVGFDPARISPHRRGIALSLVDRMAAVGGRAGVTSSAGGGTRVRLEWPDG